MYADRALAPWLDSLRDAVPDLEIVDGHLHVGLADPAGLEATADEALASLDLADARGIVFPLSEPGGYREANEGVLRLAEQHPDRVIPFVRLDPEDDAA